MTKQIGLDLPCAFEGCQSTKIRARGYCGTHYNRLRREGAFVGMARAVPSAYIELDNFLVAEVDQSQHNPSARNLYYRAVSAGKIKKDRGDSRANYNKIIKRCVVLRKTGRIGWERIADESRAATTVDHYDARHISPKQKILNSIEWSGYQLSPWHEKDVVAEVWVESRSAAQSLRPACQSLCVDVVPLGGQTSYPYIREQVLKIGERGKNTHVLCLTDYDKSGLEIAGKAKEKADYFLEQESLSQEITFERIGITEGQIDAYALNTGEPNAKSKKHAPWITRTCEIEAMMTDDIVALVIDALSPYITEQDLNEKREMAWRLNSEVEGIAGKVRRFLHEADV